MSSSQQSSDMEDIFRLVRIVAVLITAVVISLVGGCQAGNWVQAQKDITLARGLTDPVAQRLWALGKVLDGVNAGSYAETAARKESLIREILFGKDPVSLAATQDMARAAMGK